MYELAEKMKQSNQELKERAKADPDETREICRQNLKRINANAQSDQFPAFRKPKGN